MKERESNVLSLLEDKTNIYARKIALGMKTQFGWKELTYDGLGLMSIWEYKEEKNSRFFLNLNQNTESAFLHPLYPALLPFRWI